MTVDSESLIVDLIGRVERALTDVAHLAVDTGVTFSVVDVVDAVERALPVGYPAPAVDGVAGRRALVQQIAESAISGQLYED
ncbi:hypothetical protein ACFC1T_14680 [Kitasatospora sp. NPDC056076]|uniref:hypothetical protein n=1 Tax=Kitasatospora sp. NPDC056076 TaxID=3345703 RepID=UPI0035DC686E